MPFSLLNLEKNGTCDGMNLTHLTWLLLLRYLIMKTWILSPV